MKLKSKWTWILALTIGLLLLAAGGVAAGGWAVLTLEEMPESITAGESFTIRFAIRQHGQHLSAGLKPKVTAVHPASGESLKFDAQETADPGYYTAVLALPQSGGWEWEIDGFGVHPMPPLTVQAAPAAPVSRASDGAARGLLALSIAAGLGTAVAFVAWTRQQTRRRLGLAAGLLVVAVLGLGGWLWASSPVVAQSEEVQAVTAVSPGEALFISKGCVTCHNHSGVTLPAGFGGHFGPDLSAYKGSPEYLRLWLHDPANVKPETLMPNLQLSDADIETLIQFLAPG